MTSNGYGRVTVITNSHTDERQAVATVVLLLSKTRKLKMTSSGYGRVTVVTNSDIEK
jgi:hypothetical protein